MSGCHVSVGELGLSNKVIVVDCVILWRWMLCYRQTYNIDVIGLMVCSVFSLLQTVLPTLGGEGRFRGQTPWSRLRCYPSGLLVRDTLSVDS